MQTAALENLARVGAKLAITKLNRKLQLFYLFVPSSDDSNMILNIIMSVSERLGKGVELPRLKHAELTNTTLEVETVSLNRPERSGLT